MNIIEKFYSSFANKNAEGMAKCYHDEIRFHDPAFGDLKGTQVSNMWRMLLNNQKGKEFIVEYSDIKLNGDIGFAHWEARYDFGKTGRRVHNKIDAEMKIKDGKIIEHIDTFDLSKWSKMALGVPGYLLGWSGYFKKKLQIQTQGMLRKYEQNKNIKKNSSY